MIAKSFHVEGPTWAPNGRYLLYFKEERTAEDGMDQSDIRYQKYV